MFEKIIKRVKKFVDSKILRKKYYRTGNCLGCGGCCKRIYIKHASHVVKDEKEFSRLQYLHRFYTYLTIVEKDETGLVFECSNLDPVTNLCKIHDKRPGICRRYPQEELFSMGGEIAETCGYKMKPMVSFSEVLQKELKK